MSEFEDPLGLPDAELQWVFPLPPLPECLVPRPGPPDRKSRETKSSSAKKPAAARRRRSRRCAGKSIDGGVTGFARAELLLEPTDPGMQIPPSLVACRDDTPEEAKAKTKERNRISSTRYRLRTMRFMTEASRALNTFASWFPPEYQARALRMLRDGDRGECVRLLNRALKQ